jgi:hypothetical protein
LSSSMLDPVSKASEADSWAWEQPLANEASLQVWGITSLVPIVNDFRALLQKIATQLVTTSPSLSLCKFFLLPPSHWPFPST